MSARRRSGFVLLTVLWALSLAAVIVLGSRAYGLDAIRSTHNRIAAERGRWLASGCVAYYVSALNANFQLRRDADDRDDMWFDLNGALLNVAPHARCLAELGASGRLVDVNSASVEQIARVLEAAGVGHRADRLAAAAVASRDAHGLFATADQLSFVPGFANRPDLWRLFGVAEQALLVTHAPRAALASIPGLGPEAREILATRAWMRRPKTLADLLPHLSQEGRAHLLSHFEAASRLVTFAPNAWELTVVVSLGTPAVTTTQVVTLRRTADALHATEGFAW